MPQRPDVLFSKLYQGRRPLGVTIAIGQLGRYYRFLHLILERYQAASRSYVANTKSQAVILERVRSRFTDDEAAVLEDGRLLHDQVQLEIESFYLFAKIFLDKVARFLEFYFGPARNASLDKHSKLVKTFSVYSESKGLVVPPDFLTQAVRVENLVSEHRNKQIAHERSATTMHLTTVDAQGRTRIAKNQPGPLEDRSRFDSAPLEDLMKEMDRYAEMVVEVVESNSDKATYEKARTARKLK